MRFARQAIDKFNFARYNNYRKRQNLKRLCQRVLFKNNVLLGGGRYFFMANTSVISASRYIIMYTKSISYHLLSRRWWHNRPVFTLFSDLPCRNYFRQGLLYIKCSNMSMPFLPPWAALLLPDTRIFSHHIGNLLRNFRITDDLVDLGYVAQVI